MARVQNYKQAFLNRMEENKPPHRVIKVSAEIKRDGRGTGIVRHATVDGEARTTLVTLKIHIFLGK